MIKGLIVAGIAAAASGIPIYQLHASPMAAVGPAPAAYAVVFLTAAQLPATRVVTLKITGMTCGGCVIGVRTVLGRLEGVTSADVSYENANAIVHFDPLKVSTEQMIAAIKTLGYTAVVAA